MFFVYKSARDYIKTTWYVLAFALVALFFTLTPHHFKILESLDLKIAHGVNSLIGHWYAYDSFLNDINKKSAIYIIGFIFLCIYLVHAWNERYWDMGRLLGYLLWISAGAVIAILVAYQLTDTIEEKLHIRGPSYVMKDFRDINQINASHKWRVDTTDKRSVPSRNTTIFFSVVWLAFFRSRKLSYALLVPTLVFSPAAMLVGKEWPSSVIAGVFWGGTVASFLTRTPLAVIPQWLEERSIVWTEALLTFWTPTLPQRTAHEIESKTVEIPHGPRVIIKAMAVEGRDHLVTLIDNQILPLLNCAPNSEVQISAIPPDDPQAKPSRWMRFVTGGGLERGIVVKAAWKNPFNTTQRQRFMLRRNAANMHALLELRRIPVPRLLFSQNTRRMFAPRRFFFTVEDLMHERRLVAGSMSDCLAATAVLARMHAIARDEAGGLFGLQIPRSRYPHRSVLPRVRESYTTIIRELPMAELSFFSHHTLDWFWERAAQAVENGQAFALCHGHLGPENMRFTAAEPTLLGFSHASFDLPGFDLLRAMALWSDGKQDVMVAMCKSYFGKATEDEWLRFSQNFEMYLALTMFELMHENLLRPEKARNEPWLRRTSGRAAEVLRGGAKVPSSPEEAANSAHSFLFGS